MRIAVFDFDGTITTRDTLLEFIKHARGATSLYRGLLRYSPLLIAYKLHLYSNERAKERLFAHFFRGMALSQFDRLCQSFFEKKGRGMLRPQAIEAIQERLQDCDRVLIASASISNWIRPFADNLGIKEILSTEIEVDEEGCLTGRFANRNCYGTEKVARLRQLFPNSEAHYLIVYGDSRGDSPLLDCADESYYRTF